MATTAGPDFRAVLGEFGRTIRRHRQDCPPMEMARLLLSFDGPGQLLVGVRRDGERAVYFDEDGRRAIAIRFDAGGLDPRGAAHRVAFGHRGRRGMGRADAVLLDVAPPAVPVGPNDRNEGRHRGGRNDAVAPT